MASTTAPHVRHRRDTVPREETWSQALLFVGPALAFVVALVLVR